MTKYQLLGFWKKGVEAELGGVFVRLIRSAVDYEQAERKVPKWKEMIFGVSLTGGAGVRLPHTSIFDLTLEGELALYFDRSPFYPALDSNQRVKRLYVKNE